MIEKILNMVSLFKLLPDPIGYSTYGPISFPLPKEIKDVLGESALNEIDNVTEFYITIDNFTNREVEEVNILYRGGFSYTPEAKFHRRDVEPSFIHDNTNKLLSIKKIPPRDSLSITVFLQANENIVVDSVLFEGNLVTKWMNKISDFYKFPKFAIFSFVAFFIILAMFIFVFLTTYKVWVDNEKVKPLNEIIASWDGCYPYQFKNSVDNEKLLKRRFEQQYKYRGIIFGLNKVNSFDELRLKDDVWLCEGKKIF